MSIIKELINSLPQVGTVEWLSCRPNKRGKVNLLKEMIVTKENGIEGDHYSKEDGKRMVTLIQKEHIDVMANILKVDNIDPTLLRRNIVVSGINLLSMHKRHMSIGTVILECTGYCHPCSRMETNLGAGGYNAMRGHGGLTARVIQGGEIRIGDEVRLLKEP